MASLKLPDFQQFVFNGIDFHGRNAMASLKPGFGHVPGENEQNFHGRNAMASLKLHLDANRVIIDAHFHGRNAMASLKPMVSTTPP